MANNIFDKVELRSPNRSTFDLSHESLLTCNYGTLIPNFVQEVIPGDHFSVGQTTFCRSMPMIAPIMHEVDIYQHYFFVPNRLIWEEWETFITGGEDGKQMPTPPYFSIGDMNDGTRTKKEGTIFDYFGVPIVDGIFCGGNEDITISALPFRAFQKIWNDYYRDQNVQEEVDYPMTSGVDTLSWLTDQNTDNGNLPQHAWSKDYFTSALPWTQRGTEVTIPLEGYFAENVNTSISPAVNNDFEGKKDAGVRFEANGESDPLAPITLNSGTNGDLPGYDLRIDNRAINSSHDIGHLTANAEIYRSTLNEITNHEHLIKAGTEVKLAQALTLNALRVANAIQSWLERNALGGGRYAEQIRSHFAVTPDDGRLQRARFLGGSRAPLTISEVLSQVNLGEGLNSQLGSMGGHAVSANSEFVFSENFNEHGFIIGIMFVQPKAKYFQGVPRMLTRKDKFDYPFPEFAHLGEQEVYDYELYCDSNTDITHTFGYQSRYAEWKTALDRVHGDFRDTLDYWHLGRKFDNQPGLNADFLTYTPDNRIYPVTDSEHDYLLFDIQFNVKKRTSLPYFGTPSLGSGYNGNSGVGY